MKWEIMNVTHIKQPDFGEKITCTEGKLSVPDHPIIPFIEGDGIGKDLWSVSRRVFDVAVMKAYGGRRRISWMEVFAGEKANDIYGKNTWMPEETLEAFKTCVVGIKGPLTTPVGEGVRSLTVALRQNLDLYACVRPIKYMPGVPSPVKKPENTNMVVFRENSEDIYAGIEFASGEEQTARLIHFLKEEMGVTQVPSSKSSGIGIKPVSKEGTERLVRAAILHAIQYNLPSVTLVHKGNIMKFTEGAFKEWAYDLARKEFSDKVVIAEDVNWNIPEGKIVMKDVLADAFLQQILTRPAEYSVIATLNLNGDYISDALSATVGGIGFAPSANVNMLSGHALFEATHGTAPKYTGKDKVNPSSLILSGEMMFRYIGWDEAADLLLKGLEKTIAQKKVTYDFARLMEDAEEVRCSVFAEEIVKNMA